MLQKVAGSVELAPRRVSVDATEATLCGIAVPFSAAITPAEVDAKAKLQARGVALEEALLCLLGKEEEFTGTLELDAELAAKGTVEAIEKLARADLIVHSLRELSPERIGELIRGRDQST